MAEMIPTPEDLARDATADLAVCDAATDGTWDDNGADHWGTIPVYTLATDVGYITTSSHFGQPEQARADAAFIALARTALPAWIRRAVAAEAEVTRQHALLTAEPELKHLSYTPEGGLEIEIEHWAVKYMAASLWKTFVDGGGVNFVTMEIGGLPRGPIEVTLRPAGPAKTPGQKLSELQDAIRHVRDQKGDDRCWADWHAVYALLPEGYTPPKIDTEIELDNCKEYLRSCRDPQVTYVSPQRRIEYLEEALRQATSTFCISPRDPQMDLQALETLLAPSAISLPRDTSKTYMYLGWVDASAAQQVRDALAAWINLALHDSKEKE